MNKRKKFQLIAIIILGLVIVFEIAWLFQQKKPADTQDQTQVDTEIVETQESQGSTENTTIPETSEGDVPTEPPAATETAQTLPKETVPSTEPNTEPSRPENPPKAPVQDNSLYFPYSIHGSNLVIEQMNSYDGIFFEDGSDKDVTNVTAMVLTNTGDACIEYVDITIERNGVELKFTASAIEAGGTVIVLEAGGKQFSNGKYSKCVAEFATMTEMEMSLDQVRVEETAEGGLLVTNIAEKDIPCVRIFYKFYMYDSDVYVGGITYTAKIVDLAAGDSCVVTPSHYLQGYSKVVMVKTYDTDA